MVDRSRLRQFMIESFSEDELADLVFDYFPNARSVLSGSMTLGQKVRALIDFADRHDRLEHLIVVLEKQRGDAYCNFFQTDLALPPEPKSAARNPNKVFVSYANTDYEFAARLAADLRQQGFDVWMAPDSILPGEKWVAAIERGLRESGIFLLVLTPAGVESRWVSQETQIAIMLENEGKMRIYPLRVRRAEVPLMLATRQHIAFDTDYDRGLTGLMAVLRPGQKPAAPPAPAPLPRPAVTETLLVNDMLVPVLIVDRPDTLPQEFTLAKSAYTIGRAPDNDIILALPIVSSHHLLLETEPTSEKMRVWLTDVGSRNGTFLDGQRLPPNARQPLEPGDIVNLGDRAGRAVSLILRPPSSAAAPPIAAYRPLVAAPSGAAYQPPVAASRPPAAAPLAEVYKPAVAAPPPIAPIAPVSPAPSVPLNAGSPTAAAQPGALSRVPIWAYAAVGLVLVALLAFFVLRGLGGDEPPATADPSPAATSAVGAAADPSATPPEEAAVAVLPTTPPTVEPTAAATTSPTEEPTATTEATATAEATATPEPTATTGSTATGEATATTESVAAAAELSALPTLAPNFAISLDTPLGFETQSEWLRDGNSRAEGEASLSGEQVRGGRAALRLAYDFPGTGDDYVIFLTPRGVPIDSTGDERFIKVWALGDGARLNLSAILEDAEGELWKVFMGEIDGTEWQRLEGYIGDTNWPSGVFLTPRNGELDFPVRLRGFHLDDATPDFIGAGAVFLDDVTVE